MGAKVVPLGMTELCLLLAIFAVGFVPALWTAIDAARMPDGAWEATDQNKLVWVVGPVAATVLCALGGAVMAGFYFYRIRPPLREWHHRSG